MTPPDPARSQSAAAVPDTATPPRQPRLLRRLFQWLLRHVRSLHAALGVYLAVGLGLLAATIGGFAALARQVGEGQTQRFDDAVLLWLHGYDSPRLESFALELSGLGAGLAVFIVLLTGTAFLWASRHRYSVLLLWMAVAGGQVLNVLLKSLFARPRPQLFRWHSTARLSSFPSGHALTAVIVYATLAYLVARLTPSHGMRVLTFAVALVLVLGIGWSRLYLGVHYPSDVAAGYAIGFAWSTFCALGLEMVRFFRTRPEVARKERHLSRPATPIS